MTASTSLNVSIIKLSRLVAAIQSGAKVSLISLSKLVVLAQIGKLYGSSAPSADDLQRQQPQSRAGVACGWFPQAVCTPLQPDHPHTLWPARTPIDIDIVNPVEVEYYTRELALGLNGVSKAENLNQAHG